MKAMHPTRIWIPACSILLGLAMLTTTATAVAADGADWLPLRGKAVPVGCTWTPSCGGYHPSSEKAIDFPVDMKTPVFAAGEGTVVETEARCPRVGYCSGGRGNHITIQHRPTHFSRYLHLSSLVVTKNKKVKAGQLIGYSGSSGQSVEPHLHYDELTSPGTGKGKRDPGTLYACHGSTRKKYGNWPVRKGSSLRNDGYEFGCANGAISIFARANSRYVSAELRETGNRVGMLRARNSTVGSWEKFAVVGNCREAPGCALRSHANGRYVSAEIRDPGAQKGMLRARATSVGTWERFRISGDCTVGCALKSMANKKWVSAERDYTGSGKGMLRARNATVGLWEKFRFTAR